MHAYTEEIQVNILSLEDKDGINIIDQLVLKPKIAKKRSMEIDKNLELESKIIKLPSTKVLILGSSDAGKSTLIRGMRIKYVKNFTLEEKEYFKLIIHKNIIDTLKKLIKYYIKNCNLKNNGTDQKVQLQLSTNASVNMEDFYLYLNLFKSHDFKCRLSSEIKNAVQVTWNNEIIKKIFFNKTQCGINIQDTTIYYFNDLQRLLDEKFSPTELDVLYLKNATKTVTETVIHTRTMNIKLFDVGGQKRLRNSWTPFFDDVSMILFVVALSSYNQMMKEDPTVNRLNDSFTLFESLANNKLLRGCKFILLLNKIDLLAEKLKLIPLKTYFNDYEGGADTKLAKNYFRKKFLEKSKGREIKHILFITATELSAMKRITGNLVKVIGNVAMKASPVTSNMRFQIFYKYLQISKYTKFIPNISKFSNMYEGYSSITAADLEQSTPWQYSDSKLDQCDNEIRVSFVRKVYAILNCQLLFTTVVSATFFLLPQMKFWFADNFFVIIIFMISSIVVLLALFYYRRSHPLNLYLLGLFTLLESVTIGSVISFYDSRIVLQALILTLGAFIGLSIFTVQSKWDFSGMAPFLCGALFALILTGFVQIFFPFNRIFDLVIAIITALDTFVLFSKLSAEEYIEASVVLYLDFLNLFLAILRMLNDFYNAD
ncbi:hypothetical protein HDU92_003576 [Lobulomyces angularis]|nr:hypothetical protein HDU92_003576 [Lobulomyces angularis]